MALVDFPEGGDEDFLREILDIVVMPQPHGEEAPDAPLMAENERRECRGIAILRRADQSRFVVGGQGRIHAFWK